MYIFISYNMTILTSLYSGLLGAATLLLYYNYCADDITKIVTITITLTELFVLKKKMTKS